MSVARSGGGRRRRRATGRTAGGATGHRASPALGRAHSLAKQLTIPYNYYKKTDLDLRQMQMCFKQLRSEMDNKTFFLLYQLLFIIIIGLKMFQCILLI